MSEKDIRRTICPYDGHMSNKGGALYAQVLGDFLKEQLEARGPLHATHDVTTPMERKVRDSRSGDDFFRTGS